MNLKLADVRLLAEPRTQIAEEHPFNEPDYDHVSWKMTDFADSTFHYRMSEQVVARSDQPWWRVWLESNFHPAFSSASTVIRGVLTTRNLYLEFMSGDKVRVPVTSIWGRIETQRYPVCKAVELASA